MKERNLSHEFRTYQRLTDEIYENMMMCRDKTILAVNREKLAREEQWIIGLHDPTFRFEMVDQTSKGSIRLLESGIHEWYQSVPIVGNYEEKLAALHESINEGTEVYVGTIHPNLPFSNRYGLEIEEGSYKFPNHVFAILAEDADNYIYFDTSSIKSREYIPFIGNYELGIIPKKIIECELEKLCDLSVIKWNEEKKSKVYLTPFIMLTRFLYEKNPNDEKEVNKGIYGRHSYSGVQGIKKLAERINSMENGEKDIDYSFTTSEDILNWKLKDVWTRRYLWYRWLEMKGFQKQAQAFKDSYMAWKQLAFMILYFQGRGEGVESERIREIIATLINREYNLQDAVHLLFR